MTGWKSWINAASLKCSPSSTLQYSRKGTSHFGFLFIARPQTVGFDTSVLYSRNSVATCRMGSRCVLCTVDNRRVVKSPRASLSELRAERTATESLADVLVEEGVLSRGSRLHRQFLGLSGTRAERIVSALNQRTNRVAVVLDGVHGVHNLAAVCRSCDAFGIQTVHFVPPERYATGACRQGPALDLADRSRYLRQFLRAAACDTASGAHKWLSLQAHGNAVELLDKMRAEGYRIFASSVQPNCCVSLYDINFDQDANQKCAFVFGSESSGVSRQIHDSADVLFTIPMYGFVESLNISVSVATTLAHVTLRLRSVLGPAYNLSLAQKQNVLNFWLQGGSFAALERSRTDEKVVKADRFSRDGRSALSDFGRLFERRIWHQGLLRLTYLKDSDSFELFVHEQCTKRIQSYLIRRKGGIFGDSDCSRRRRAHAQTFAGLLAWMNACVPGAELEWATSLVPLYRDIFLNLDSMIENEGIAKARILGARHIDDLWLDEGSELCTSVAWNVMQQLSGLRGIDVCELRELLSRSDPYAVAIRVLFDILRVNFTEDGSEIAKLEEIFDRTAVDSARGFTTLQSLGFQTIIRLQHASDVRRMLYLCIEETALPHGLKKQFLHHPRHGLYELYLTHVIDAIKKNGSEQGRHEIPRIQLESAVHGILKDCSRLCEL
ncbi:hypothetical protein F1559_004766 [Cyanidiococcus yangmingshanensis]|uniref:tRNA/rRNA methyltransferase SpoU type domain-containing protein n=1 Tax=Cyanidiococcus yangmingshanensis TaxID=2690220 RepID=A0A7J7IKQ7_9RHOD|nr:hypothetical protein F1559_004766 [Cyanidiococcus yangmingshanensis]